MSEFIKSGIKAKSPKHLDKFLRELNELQGVVSSFYRGTTDSIVVKTDALWSEDVFNTFFEGYDDVDLNCDAYDEYLKHESNGIEEFRLLRANSVALIATGQRSFSDAMKIEESLRNVKAAIITGDWGTGLDILVNNTPVNESFTQEIKNEIILKIQTYINNEYILLHP